MKKVLAVMLSIAMCLSFTTVAFADEDNITTDSDAEFVYAWNAIRNGGYLKVSDEGLLQLEENNSIKSLTGYDLVVDMIAICNESIQDGIMLLDPETLELSSVINPEIQQPYGLTNHVAPVIPRNGAHGCSVQALNLLNMCENNYQTLSDYYDDMMRLTVVSPGINALGSTIAFWIDKVRPNGDWDYKTQPGFAPWNTQFCSYFDGGFQHITSEYIGNFNYGYTGSFLFPLDILHFGSSAVAGFNPADESDWPAIDAGYNNAT